jgi:DNA-binding beta-propeller fold protein YncE
MARVTRLVFAAAGLLMAIAAPAAAQEDCNAPAADVTSFTSLPGLPFSAIPSADGCTVFVSLFQGRAGSIAVFKRASGKLTLLQNIAVPRTPGGMTLNRDGKWLVAADQQGVMVFDTARLISGDGTPIVSASDNSGRPAGSIYAAISPDDKLLFVSDENNASLTVYDFAALRGGSTSAIGRVSVGFAPVGLVFSGDGRTLYSTSEVAKSGPKTCPPEGGAPRPTPQGELTVVDVTKAATDPAGAVLARIPAGCDPVRVALASNGRLFVTIRGDNAVQVFDTSKLSGASAGAMIAKVAVGDSPVGVTAAGDRVFVANSNRFAPPGRKGEWLSVLDARTNEVDGAVPAGLFPRELKVTPDGKTLLVTNFNSKSLELVDLARLTVDYFAQQRPVMTADLAGQASANAAIQARIKAKTPSPGTEAAVRHQIEGLLRGEPDYGAMTPDLADVSRPQAEGILKNAAQWGALKSLTLDSITPQGMDIYDAEFEHASIQWGIAPLTSDGKISVLFFRPKT